MKQAKKGQTRSSSLLGPTLLQNGKVPYVVLQHNEMEAQFPSKIIINSEKNLTTRKLLAPSMSTNAITY